jgi:hypothetical protein
MSPNRLRTFIILAVLAGTVAAVILIQQQVLRELHKENLAQGGQLEQLIQENRDLSNGLFRATLTQSPREAPPRELLRLRGEVGVLRRELQELQQLRSGQSPARPQGPPLNSAPSTEALVKIEDLRKRGEAVCMRFKALSDQLQEKGSDHQGLLLAIQTSGIQDDLLSTLLEERQLASQSHEVSDLDKKIEARTDGIRLGVEARAESLIQILKNMQGDSGDAGSDSINTLELNALDGLLSGIEKAVGNSP